jgi:amino acid adenylation domain-containing protein
MTRDTEITTIRDLIDGMAGARPDVAFLISPETGRVSTFKGLQEQARHLCGRFQQLGLERGDKIAFLMDNGLFTAQLFLGAMYGGFVSAPLNARAGVSQLSYMLDHCDAKVAFVGSQYNGLIKDAMASVRRPVEVISVDPDSYLEVSDSSSITLAPVAADDPALLIYSSGTTGHPKGALHTHRSVLAHGRNSACSHQLTAADRSLLVLPLYHINAECVTLMPTLTSGGSVVIPRGFAVSEFWNWLDDYHCTWSAVVPTIISQLLDWKDPKAESRAACFQRIRFLRTSSAPLSPSLHHEFIEKFKLPLIQAMGSSEAGNVFSNPVPPGRNKIGSPGLPWGFETRIVDRDGAKVPIGEPGEVLLRGDAMMQGYYKDPAGTAEALDSDGWLHTGDLAYQDEDGYFFVVGRSKELIIKGGMNIAPKQIDEVLETHRAVLEAAAVGVPDRYVGEDLVAFAVLRDGMSCDERELLSFCEIHLGHFKTPTRIHFVRDLPKGPSGKVQRLRLVEEAVRLTVAGSAALAGGSETSLKDANGGQYSRSAAELPVEQIIAGIWSDLLAQPQIDSQSNFFALGGQSLLAIQCLSRLREKIPVMLSLSDFFENPTVARQAALVRNLLSSSPARETAGGGQSSVDLQPVPLRDRSLPCPLSHSQERLWFLEQLNAGAPAYNEAEAVRLRGKLDIEVLEQAFNVIITRHEILRTTIEVRDERPVAIVHESWPVRFKRIDLRRLATDAREAELARLLVDEPRHRYRLEAEPAIRATVIEMAAEDHVFILMMHHIVCDASSLGILWRELATLYEACLRGQPSPLPPLPIQFGDYAAWLRQPTQQARFDEELSFWKENLRGAPTALDLPADRPRPSVISYRGDKRRFPFDPALAKELRDLCRREHTSAFTVFAAALNTLLHRYTGQDDILVGIPIADRDRAQIQPLIGFLIDTHVLRTELGDNPTFREFLARVQQCVARVYSHRAAPFDQVVAAILPERNLSYTPVFQVALNWRNRDDMPQSIGLAGTTTEHILAHPEISKFDLCLHVIDGGDSFEWEMEYSRDLFDDIRIERMVVHLGMLLKGAVANPELRISDMPLLSPAERRQILEEWNDTRVEFPRDKCIQELFEAQVERTPEAVAVVFEATQLTYRQLNERANQLAHHLQSLGVGPDALVAICLERSLEMVVGLLGILKAGGAYVPLDPEYPGERLALILRDAKASVLLTQKQFVGKLGRTGIRVVCLDSHDTALESESKENPQAGASPENLIYEIYTSGSTGIPKGAGVYHRSFVNLIHWFITEFHINPGDSVLLVSSLSFDLTQKNVYAPLICGGKLHLLAAGPYDPGLIVNAIRRNQITLLNCTPSAFYPLIEPAVAPVFKKVASLRCVFLGGEPISIPRLRPWVESEFCHAEVVNTYGPTECTDIATSYRLNRSDLERYDLVPTGKPIFNVQVVIVDKDLQLCSVGVPGEVCIAGIGVGAGYLGNAKLTASKFIKNPFSEISGQKLYKTGDMAQYLPNGVIEYLGRLDHQVKIRGFRIELGEIESVLTGFPGVREAVVLVREDVPGEKRLIAYFCGAKDIHAAALRAHLERALPEYMVPAAYVSLAALPMTPNGKLDRRALPAPGDQAFGSQAYDAPKGPIETAIASIWIEFLQLERVGRHDDFFKLGGHSLMALRVIGAINKALEAHLRVPAFFQNPTIERLAKVVYQNDHDGQEQVIPMQTGHTGLPLYFIGARPEEYRLAKLLGEDRAIFAVDVPMLAEWDQAITAADQAALPTMEQLGSLYSDVLHAHAGSSPCVIAGYSLGGKVAFEAAHALRRAGGNVELILLVDAWAFTWTGATRGPAWQSLRRIWRGAARGSRRDPSYLARLRASVVNSWRLFLWLSWRIPQMLKGRLQSMKNRFSPEARPSGYLDKQGLVIDQTAIDRLAYIAGKVWRPRPLDASGVLFRAKAPGEELLPGYDFTNGWGKLFDRGLEIVQAAGGHNSMMVDENLPALARQINSVLDRHENERNLRVVGSGDETRAGRSVEQSRSDQEPRQSEHAIL